MTTSGKVWLQTPQKNLLGWKKVRGKNTELVGHFTADIRLWTIYTDFNNLYLDSSR